jgi:hypothetical protein
VGHRLLLSGWLRLTATGCAQYVPKSVAPSWRCAPSTMPGASGRIGQPAVRPSARGRSWRERQARSGQSPGIQASPSRENFLRGVMGATSGVPSRPVPAGTGCNDTESSRGPEVAKGSAIGPGGESGDTRPLQGGGLAAPFRAATLRARCRRRADAPHPQAGSPSRSAPAMTAPARAGRAVLLAPGILSSRKITVRALATLASLTRWRKRPPLLVIFPDKIRQR